MEKKKNMRNITLSIIVILLVITMGIGISYAFYMIGMTGKSDVAESKAAVLNLTTTLEQVDRINTNNLQLTEITENNYADVVTDKVTFTVTNESTSNINGKYNLYLKEMEMTKNLSSQYFKWAAVVSGTNSKIVTGNFLDTTNLGVEGNTDRTIVSNLTKTLIDDANALTLAPGQTDTITFYIWLENASVDQVYLTSGTFAGKLAIDAVAVK
ncbi:MAG: hypothetical protein IJ704_04655 [Bacilli bacterium]|nr:hypothetical protein [Bacilli bacterium]